MAFTQLRSFGFRNLADETVKINAPEVFFVGENGQGKSNFLEALHYLCYGSSFRTRKPEHLLRTGDKVFRLVARVSEPNQLIDELSVTFEDKKRQICFDGKVVQDRKDLLERFPCFVFCHGDIEFITGPPEIQRLFFDQTLTLLDHGYIDLLRNYRQILRSRNACIKDNRHELLSVYDEQLIEYGRLVTKRRIEVVSEFNESLSEVFERTARMNAEVNIRYLPSWKEGQESATLNRLRERDLTFATTTSGPHRDRYRFIKDGRQFTETASTGQLRLLSLVLRTAQVNYFWNKTQRRPILLLDDVLLELDHTRRERFLNDLPPYEQAFFTFLPQEPYASYRKPDTLVYEVKSGSFTLHEEDEGKHV
ncbi:MAG: DNA replication/repair protein RecF [Spirochaetaceae bacterium]|nr:MAG: DNA replication/repair protein RecF [Spirochaetaceae bacterium]